MLKIKLVASIPQPLGFLNWTLFNVGKGTNFFSSDKTGSNQGVSRERVGINVNVLYILTFNGY